MGWLCHNALAQLQISEGVTSSGNFPDLVVTCIANLSVFITCFLGRRLDQDIGARDVVAIGPKLEDIDGFGVSTCRGEYQNASVVMLTNNNPNSSMRNFMKYLSNAHSLNSIILHCNHLEYAKNTVKTCECNALRETTSSSDSKITCNCIIFCTVEDITIILANRMLGTLKSLSNSLCLLPSLKCLKNGCHGCNWGVLHVESDRLTDEDSIVSMGESPAAVSETLDIFMDFFGTGPLLPNCIYIPVHPASNDDWAKLLIRSSGYEDPEIRSVDQVIVMASDALQNYMDKKGGCFTIERYQGINTIFPRFTELVINVVLTRCLRVDGFISTLVARRTVREYLLDSKGTRFPVNMFLGKSLVKSNADYTHVCKVLTFTSSVLNMRTLSLRFVFPFKENW